MVFSGHKTQRNLHYYISGESPLEMVIFDQHMNNDPVSQDVAAVAVEFAIYRLKPYFAARVYGGPGYAKAPAINAAIKSSVSGTDVKEAGKKVLKALSENSVVKVSFVSA